MRATAGPRGLVVPDLHDRRDGSTSRRGRGIAATITEAEADGSRLQRSDSSKTPPLIPSPRDGPSVGPTTPAPNWTLFAAVVLLATAALLVLSRASARVISAAEPPAAGRPVGRGHGGESGERDGDGGDAGEGTGTVGFGAGGGNEESGITRYDDSEGRPPPPMPTGAALLVNVAFTHGLLGVGLLALVWYAAIPPESLGIGPSNGHTIATGVGLGVGLYLASEATTAITARVGIEPDERLRAYLAPERPTEWAALLLVILPLIAGAEELLFRGILIGALGTGFGLDPWGLAIGSSILFGLAHSAQGALGVAVTAALGFALAAAFVLTGSLAVVVLAHYTIDALEFVIREGVLD